jgi:hypothetical protein
VRLKTRLFPALMFAIAGKQSQKREDCQVDAFETRNQKHNAFPDSKLKHEHLLCYHRTNYCQGRTCCQLLSCPLFNFQASFLSPGRGAKTQPSELLPTTVRCTRNGTTPDEPYRIRGGNVIHSPTTQKVLDKVFIFQAPSLNSHFHKKGKSPR